jgi:prepilin-type N-terminal cleavage/methylation domain-containing protein
MHHSKRGFTLIELVITMLLSLGIVSLMGRLYIVQMRNLQAQAALLEISHHGAKLTALFQSAFKNIHFMGCAHWTSDFPLHNWISANQLIGLTKNHFDAVRIQKISSVGSRVVKVTGQLIFIHPDTLLQKQKRGVITDCQKGEGVDIAAISQSVNASTITAKQALYFKYDEQAEFYALSQKEFFMRKISQQAYQKKTRYGLFERDETCRTRQVVAGITDLQIRYRVNGSEVFYTASDIDNWSDVNFVLIRAILTSTSSPIISRPWFIMLKVSS